MTKTKLLLAICGLAVIVGGVAVLVSGDAMAAPPLQPANADPQAGAVLYGEACASCHGETLEGQPNWREGNDDGTLRAPPHDQTGHTWHHGDGLLFDYTKHGGQAAMAARGGSGFPSGMPGFGEALSDQQIWNILAFIKSTWPARAREVQEMQTQNEQKYGS